MRTNKKEYQKKWRAENPEKVKEHNRKWYAENPEKVKEYDRKWYAENYEKVKKVRIKYKLKEQIGEVPPPELVEIKFLVYKIKKQLK